MIRIIYTREETRELVDVSVYDDETPIEGLHRHAKAYTPVDIEPFRDYANSLYDLLEKHGVKVMLTYELK